jgi:3-oxoacyl-[acyl-carrier protein] reductase
VDEVRETSYQMVRAGIPLGRLGTTDDIADLVLFLVSDQSSYITGEAVGIGGGLT